MNILTKSILTLVALAATGLHAEVFPIAEDTFGTIAKGTILKASGAAKAITVNAKTKAYIGFDVGSSGIPTSAVSSARLTIYAAKTTKTGNLYLANATGAFSETFTAKSIPMPTDAIIGTTALTDAASREFITFDVTDQVKAWLATPSSEHGFVLAADGTLALTIATKEGAGTGHPAVLEVDVSNADANGNFLFSGGNVGIGTANPGAKLEISDGTTSLQIRPGELNGVANTSAISLEYPGFGTIGIQDSLEIEGHLTTRGDYYGFGHVFLYAFEGENSSGTAYVQARDNSGTSSIGLQLRTQSGGNIIDTMYLSPLGDVRVGVTNSRFNVNTIGAVNVTATIQARAATDIAFIVQDQNGTSNMKVGSFGIECSVGTGFKPGGGSWAVLSDARLKHNIEPLTGALDSMLRLRSVTYEYNDPAATQQPAGKQTGFIAQEVEKVFPEWVGEKTDGYKFIDIRGFESLTVQSLRELRAEKDAEIAALKAELAALKAANTALETSIAARLARLEAAASSTVTTAPVNSAAIEAK